jgi:hypothetical protein
MSLIADKVDIIGYDQIGYLNELAYPTVGHDKYLAKFRVPWIGLYDRGKIMAPADNLITPVQSKARRTFDNDRRSSRNGA